MLHVDSLAQQLDSPTEVDRPIVACMLLLQVTTIHNDS